MTENVTGFEHQQEDKMLVPNRGAKCITHNMFRELERLRAHHVANDAFNFLEVSEHDMQQEQYENIENSLEICV